jgi:putative glutamine amidotransferase
MTRPLIGVTTSRRGGWRSYLMHRLALTRAGARSVRLIPGQPLPTEPLRGLIIGGGDDIGAEIYGGQVLPDVRIDPERDKLELSLLKAALPAGLPILGICRGSQMINVALGGTLHTDIYEVYVQAPKMRTVLPRKTVSVEPSSRLNGILRCNPCQVNALHHQSVDRLGQGLTIAARDESGIVQAIENERAPFLLGVQWHPELLVWKKPQQRLFAALTEAAHAVAQPLSAAALMG